MRRLFFVSVFIIGCSAPTPLEDALARYHPEEVAFELNGNAVSAAEVALWGDEESARYAEQVVARSPELVREIRAVHAWKKGMVRALIDDKIESQPIDMSDTEQIEKIAVALRTERAKPATVRFSAVSVFAKRTVEGAEPSAVEKKAVVDAFLPQLKPYREMLLKHPTRETVQHIYDELDEKVPETIGLDLKIDARVLAKGEPQQGSILYHEALAELTANSLPGDVPALERAGFTALIILVEEQETASKIDQTAIQKEAEERFIETAKTNRFVDFMKDVYGPADVKFHPHVIQNQAKQ